MGHAASSIPEPGTYHRVLRRYDRDPRHAHQQHFVSYDVSLRAVAAEMGGKVAMTLFFPKGKDAAAHRATRQGWVDCTQEWHEELNAPDLTPLRDGLAALEWNDFVQVAKSLTGDGKGRRNDITERLLADVDHQLLMEAIVVARSA